MLLPTMTDLEVYAEVVRDYQRLEETTLPRLHHEYFKERQRLKIDKTKVYPKTYKIKSAAKNNWLIIITKSFSEPKHRSIVDQQAGSIVYYFAKDGYRFFRAQTKGNLPEMFYGHFFTRYNERMGLNLPSHIDIATHFFINNSHLLPFRNVREGKKYLACLSKGGILLGVYNDNPSWKVYKTFISHDLKHSAQKEEEQKLQNSVRQEINSFIKTYEYRNDEQFRSVKGGLEEIFGTDHVIVKTFKLLAGAEPNKAKLPDLVNLCAASQLRQHYATR